MILTMAETGGEDTNTCLRLRRFAPLSFNGRRSGRFRNLKSRASLAGMGKTMPKGVLTISSRNYSSWMLRGLGADLQGRGHRFRGKDPDGGRSERPCRELFTFSVLPRAETGI